MLGFKEQDELFSLIGKYLKKRTEVFVIGGSAMLYYNMTKIATKDVDIVFSSESERLEFASCLRNIGFKQIYTAKDPKSPHRFELKDFIFDLFFGNVFRSTVSASMLKRACERVEYGNFVVLVPCIEDIVFLKSMTDRAGDRKDVHDIVEQANVDWNIIIEEAKWQQEQSRDSSAVILLYDFLDDLVHDFKADIPRNDMLKIRALYEGKMREIERDK